jgi:hypothetical protein
MLSYSITAAAATIGADTRRWRWRDTFCQRFFTNQAKSSYFEVRNARIGTAGRPPTPERPAKNARTDDGVDRFGQLMAHAATQYETTLRDIRAVAGERGNDEPNPLLQWAGWDKCEWADLLALTKRPDPTEEPVTLAIWTDGRGRLYSERDGPPGGLRDPHTGHSDPRVGT